VKSASRLESALAPTPNRYEVPCAFLVPNRFRDGNLPGEMLVKSPFGLFSGSATHSELH
jgi:hypothetical protein